LRDGTAATQQTTEHRRQHELLSASTALPAFGACRRESIGGHSTLAGRTDGTHKMSGKGVTNLRGNANEGTFCFYLPNQGSGL